MRRVNIYLSRGQLWSTLFSNILFPLWIHTFWVGMGISSFPIPLESRYEAWELWTSRTSKTLMLKCKNGLSSSKLRNQKGYWHISSPSLITHNGVNYHFKNLYECLSSKFLNCCCWYTIPLADEKNQVRLITAMIIRLILEGEQRTPGRNASGAGHWFPQQRIEYHSRQGFRDCRVLWP